MPAAALASPSEEPPTARFGSGDRVARGPGVPLSRSIPALGDTVTDDLGQRSLLRDCVGAGGEGTVYRTDRGLVCKVFDAAHLDTRRQAKLRLMVGKPLQVPGICWPASLARNDHGDFVGYLMSAARGLVLQRALFLRPLLERHFPSWTRRELVTLATTVLQRFQALHDRNVLLGDINPLNILVASEHEVHLVDTDSYQIEDFPCPVGTPTFLSPRLAGQDLGKTLRNLEDEQFAVATLVFMLLMPGKAPYSHAGGGDPLANVRRGHFPYSLRDRPGRAMPAGPWRFMWSHLPYYFKEAFHSVFTQRGSLSDMEWISHLDRYAYDLARGHVSSEIYPSGFKRLSRDTVVRHGGTWHACGRCGVGFGTLSGAHHAPAHCPDCRVREEVAKCALCSASFSVRSSDLERLREREPICQTCRANVETRTCADCGSAFTVGVGERLAVKQRGHSTPRRCRACRARRRATRGQII